MIIYTSTRIRKCQAGDTVRQSKYLPTLLCSVLVIDKLHTCATAHVRNLHALGPRWKSYIIYAPAAVIPGKDITLSREFCAHQSRSERLRQWKYTDGIWFSSTKCRWENSPSCLQNLTDWKNSRLWNSFLYDSCLYYSSAINPTSLVWTCFNYQLDAQFLYSVIYVLH
jgi:hypothetical protein